MRKNFLILSTMAATLLYFGAAGGALAQQNTGESTVYKPPPVQQQSRSTQEMIDQYMVSRGGTQGQAAREADLQATLAQKAALAQQMAGSGAAGMMGPYSGGGQPYSSPYSPYSPYGQQPQGRTGPKYRYVNKAATDVGVPPRLFNNIPKRRP